MILVICIVIGSVLCAAVACRAPVTVTGAEAVSKSYPDFFEDMAALGLSVSRQN